MNLSVNIALISLLILLSINVPVFASILLSTLLYFLFSDQVSIMIIVQRMVGGLEKISLLAIPFFIMAGVLMNYTGITKRMIRFTEIITGHMPGGLAQTNVVLSTLMGGLSGSSIADAAMQSKILVPEMVKRGYSPAFSSVVTAASAIITPIIPPGIALIIYGYIGNVSIGKLFLAGIIPGIMTCVLMMVTVHIVSIQRGYVPIREKHASFKQIVKASKDAFLALLLPIVIIGGIRLGVFTPTEAGAIAILYAFVLGAIVYKEMHVYQIKDAIMETVVTTASIMLIIGAASTFAWFLTWEQVPQKATEFILNIVGNKGAFLLILNIFLLFIGMFIEGTAIMLVLIPILMPMVKGLGIDTVHFGLVFIFNMAVGSLSPPMGTLMFTTCTITKVKIKDFLKEAWPFYIMLLICLMLITYIPEISLFLPNLVY